MMLTFVGVLLISGGMTANILATVAFLPLSLKYHHKMLTNFALFVCFSFLLIFFQHYVLVYLLFIALYESS
jgi:hypothetical protein